jgi:hypothetical protein
MQLTHIKLRPAVRRATVTEPQAESPPIIRHHKMPLVTSALFADGTGAGDGSKKRVGHGDPSCERLRGSKRCFLKHFQKDLLLMRLDVSLPPLRDGKREFQTQPSKQLEITKSYGNRTRA